MEYALSTAPQHVEWSELGEVWQAADEAPAPHSAWLFDHFYPIFSDAPGPASRAGQRWPPSPRLPAGAGSACS